MPRYIVPDTSSLAAALYQEPASAHAAPLLQAIRLQTVEAIAPSLALPEFFNVSRKKRNGNQTHGIAPVSASLVEAIVSDFLNLRIVWEDIDALAESGWRLHRDHQIETADAFFLEAARQWQAELWTADEQFYQRATLVYPKVFNLRVTPFT